MAADPVAALIAASQGATPGPVEVGGSSKLVKGFVVAQRRTIVEIAAWCSREDAYYIAAAYDPALIPALVAQQTALAAACTAEQAARRQLQAALATTARLRTRLTASEAAIAGLVARLDAAGLGDPTGELAAIRAVLARVGEDGS